MLRLLPPEELAWWGNDILARAEMHLPPSDPRRIKLKERLGSDGKLNAGDRYLAISVLQAANIADQLEKARVRSFRNIITITTAVLTLIALTLGVIGLADPTLIKLCFNDPQTGPACPIGSRPVKWDILIVELMGLSAAALVGAIGLRLIYGTSTPFTLPIVLAFLKLPAGAISAVIGLLLIQGRFIPGLSNLDTSAQILGWAAVFGAAQQAITRLVDAQGQKILSSVGDPAPEPPTASPVKVTT
ncbi:hypothetical protein HTZ77_25795 [Nonomuraea sp. SMC257]|uniref:Uncharacterized protein n=1 Tax=Nonomuraea montanisoli TaxID=2741721 RepID=A0A7Y6M4Y7_9ACTN|nr:hypothetical protein [Nonomuraea montanisoli]